MPFLFNDDKDLLSLVSAQSIYGSSKNKIFIFTIESYREKDGDFVELPDYKKLTNMIESFNDIKFYFSHDGDVFSVESFSFDKNPHLKDGVEIVTVYLE